MESGIVSATFRESVDGMPVAHRAMFLRALESIHAMYTSIQAEMIRNKHNEAKGADNG